MISALILPAAQMDDTTIDQVVDTALHSGLIACNCTTGPFRIAFFPRDRVPAGWSRIGFAQKATPCAA